MKAMILAAGLGSRMRPLTLTTPKPLLKVANKPLIVWHIEALKASGIQEIVINAAWLKDQLQAALGDGRQFGVKIQWSLEEEGLETAGGIIQALPYLGEQPFIVVNADVWSSVDFAALRHLDLAQHWAHLLLVDNPVQHPQGDFILTAAGRVASFEQQQPGEALTFAGISLLSPQLFAGLPAGKRPLAPLLRQAMQQGLVRGEKIQAQWVDVGTPERLQQLDASIRRQMLQN
jgi:MurNAc alpha-1-phosphate uridylyltransferase